MGVSPKSFKHTFHTIKLFLGKYYKVKTISAKDLKLGIWRDKGEILIIPGGADKYYVKRLGVLGEKIIKEFILSGGKFIGICAGAYFASSEVVFAKGSKIEVIGKRGLALFKGRAVGPVSGGYCYSDNSCAMAISVRHSQVHRIFFNGGCYFEKAEDFDSLEVIAFYDDKGLPAILNINQGQIILSGVHFEYDPTLLDSNDIYLNKIKKHLEEDEKARVKLVKKIFSLIIEKV